MKSFNLLCAETVSEKVALKRSTNPILLSQERMRSITANGKEYLITSYGRVLTHAANGKYAVVKTVIGEDGQYSFDGIPLAKTVADCFGVKGDYIHHLNGDVSDNRIDNLIPSHVPENVANLSFKAKDSLTQFDLMGNVAATWSSADEAAEVLGFRKGDIIYSAAGNTLTAHNYVWDFCNCDRPHTATAEYKLTRLSKFIITAQRSNEIYYYAGIYEAASDMGVAATKIYDCIRNKITYNGFSLTMPFAD